MYSSSLSFVILIALLGFICAADQVAVNFLVRSLPYVEIFQEVEVEVGLDDEADKEKTQSAYIGRVNTQSFKSLSLPFGTTLRIRAYFNQSEPAAGFFRFPFSCSEFLLSIRRGKGSMGDVEKRDDTPQAVVCDFDGCLYGEDDEHKWEKCPEDKPIRMIIGAEEHSSTLWLSESLLPSQIESTLQKWEDECRGSMGEDGQFYCGHVYRNWVLAGLLLNRTQIEERQRSENEVQLGRGVEVMKKALGGSFPLFTDKGYKFVKMSNKLADNLKSFYDENRNRSRPEPMPVVTGAVTGGESDTWMLKMPDELEASVTKECRAALYKWVKRKYSLVHSQNYGVRIYRNGSFLHPHVDRVHTHILSCIACVSASDEKAEGWESTVVDRGSVKRMEEGKQEEPDFFRMKVPPGSMLLYESASSLHGREGPLEGAEIANIFLHFRPVGWPEQFIGSEEL